MAKQLTHFLPEESAEAPKPAPTKPAPDPKEVQRQKLAAEYDIPDEDHGTPEPVVASAPSVTPAAAERLSPGSGSSQPQHKHPTFLTQLAKDELGYDDDELASMPTKAVEKALMAIRQAQRRQPTPAPVESSAPSTPATSAAKPAPPPDDALDFGDHKVRARDKDGYETDELVPAFEGAYDPGLIKILKDQQKKIKALEAIVGQVAGHIQAEVSEKVYGTVDQVFSNHPELFGEGTRHDIDPKSDEFARRRAVAKMADEVAEVHKQLGVKSTIKQRVEQSIQALFGVGAEGASPKALPSPAPTAPKRLTPPKDPVTGLFVSPKTVETEPEETEATERQKAWMQAGVRQPTNREAPELPHGRQRAIKALEQRRREAEANGVYDDGDANDDEI